MFAFLFGQSNLHSSPAGMIFFPDSNIICDIVYDVVYDIAYDISYDIVCDVNMVHIQFPFFCKILCVCLERSFAQFNSP
jgi:hypothetical protein